MMISKKIKTIIIISFLFILVGNFSYAVPSGGAVGGVDKQLLEELDKAGTASNLSAKDPRLIVADIVKTLLSILGTIFLVLVVYAGFLWMTAAGDEKKVEKAQSIIKMAIIGLAVVLLSYAITLFVVNVLLLPARA